jgi:hypothetical protein
LKAAVLIVTYSSPIQTKRLIDSLNNGSFDFYIHLDKKIDIKTHQALFNIPNVFFIDNRIDIKWAGYTTAMAAMSGVRQIVKSGIHYDFVNLITGQDYPVKSAGYIANFLEKNIGNEFILHRDFETEWTEAKSRVEKYHFTDLTFKGKYMLQDIVNWLMPKREFPMDMRLCGKETFWTLSLACAKYVVDVIDANPKLNRFLKYTWGSDEFIFQTIIMSSPFAAKVINKNYRYIDWPPGGARPKLLVTEDFDRIMASDALFGRKFDMHADENILDLLDKANAVAAEPLTLKQQQEHELAHN